MEESITLLTKIKQTFDCEGAGRPGIFSADISLHRRQDHELVIQALWWNVPTAPPMTCIKKTTRYVAPAQSAMIEALLPEPDGGRGSGVPQRTHCQILHHGEKCFCGRLPQSYWFEALMEYLYLTGQTDRMLELIETVSAWQVWRSECNVTHVTEK